MSRRAFLTLFAVTLLTAIVALGLLISEQVSANVPRIGGAPMFPEIGERVDDLDRLVIENRRYSIALENRDGTWVAVNQGDYPVKLETAARIVGALAAMTIVEPKTGNPEWYQYIGVADPRGTDEVAGVHIAATDAAGVALADAIFGFESTTIGYSRLGGSFVRRTNEDLSWLVEGAVIIPGFLQEWFDQILHVPGTEVAAVAVFAGDELLFDAEKTDFTNGIYTLRFLDPSEGPAGATALGQGIRGVTQAIVSTTFDDARPLSAVTFADDARTVRFTTRSGVQIDVKLGMIDGEEWVTYNATAPDGTEAAVQQAAGVNARTANWAFKLPAYRLTALNHPISDLIALPAPAQGIPPGGLMAPAAPPIAPGDLLPLPPAPP